MKFATGDAKIGYPCIFSTSVEDAASNLLRLITKKQCGYDEGAEWWVSHLSEWLDNPHGLLSLNCCGAKFTENQWRSILHRVIDGLKAHLPEQHDT
jgi:hypothetical protein